MIVDLIGGTDISVHVASEIDTSDRWFSFKMSRQDFRSLVHATAKANHGPSELVWVTPEKDPKWLATQAFSAFMVENFGLAAIKFQSRGVTRMGPIHIVAGTFATTSTMIRRSVGIGGTNMLTICVGRDAAISLTCCVTESH